MLIPSYLDKSGEADVLLVIVAPVLRVKVRVAEADDEGDDERLEEGAEDGYLDGYHFTNGMQPRQFLLGSPVEYHQTVHRPLARKSG